jgi:hypothetical protein
MAAFWAVFTFGGSGPDITAHGSLDLKQEIQIQIHKELQRNVVCFMQLFSKVCALFLMICARVLLYAWGRTILYVCFLKRASEFVIV